MIGHKLNGFTVIAAVRQFDRQDQQVIVAERRDPATGRPTEYVSARMPTHGAPPREWDNGMYVPVRMDDKDGVQAYTNAVSDMLRRAGFVEGLRQTLMPS